MRKEDLIKQLKFEGLKFFRDIESFRTIIGTFKDSEGNYKQAYGHECKYDDVFYDIHLRAYDLVDVMTWSSDPSSIKARALELHDDSKIGDRDYYVIWEKKNDVIWLEPKLK